MKNFIIVFLIFPLLLNSQTAELKAKQALGNEKYLEYLTKYPDSIEYYKFFVENGFRISKKEYVSEEKLTNA
ncbi:MAG: hypothetical protein N3A01_06930, partial [Bacteroidales bacterium]|nr:hypothetical protein [Bacteroidales bacterium]